MKHIMKRFSSVLALTCTVFLHPGYAEEGQEQVADQIEPSAPQNNRRVIEEVIVTATKKETSIQDVPISITAINNEFIQKAAIDDIRELVLFTPNVTYSTANTAKVRALGGLFADSSLDSSVGLVVDDLALTNTIFIAEPIFDLERFEVLRHIDVHGGEDALVGIPHGDIGAADLLAHHVDFTGAQHQHVGHAGVAHRQALDVLVQPDHARLVHRHVERPAFAGIQGGGGVALGHCRDCAQQQRAAQRQCRSHAAQRSGSL